MSDHAAILALQQQVADLVAQLTAANAQSTALQTAPPPPAPVVNVAAPTPTTTAAPDAFDGSSSQVESFIHKCELYFLGHNLNDTQKVNSALSRMTSGRALIWVQQAVTTVAVGTGLGWFRKG
jgi:hypothetical protein